MAKDLDLIWVSGEAENFLKWDWTRGIMLNPFNKFRFARKPQGRAVSQSGWRITPSVQSALPR
jgi:hypothetical protein